MKLYSTNNKESNVDFETAVFNSLPADKGLYMPDFLPQLDAATLESWSNKTFPEIAFDIAYTLLKEDISSEDLKAIINDAINFDAPLLELSDNTFVLELFQGPSLAFKDFGARFMSRIMSHFLQNKQQNTKILVATSGDTGGAVALGFLNVEGIHVHILYPKGKVSPIQELQLTTNGDNIEAIEIDGTFDDCQSLVKQAFLDDELNKKFNLTSANSINISRLIPQMFYYGFTWARLKDRFNQFIFITPSGNFGNIAAGLLLHKMGLPNCKFIAATNSNDIVPNYFKTGIYAPKASVTTLANAMDVGDPSNFVRILDLFNNDIVLLRSSLSALAYTDEQIKSAIKHVHSKFDYIVCPHTATAYLAAQEIKNSETNAAYVMLATAHPCKFPDVYEELNIAIEEPEQVNDMKKKESKKVTMANDYQQFKSHLLK